jgi:hypothetical protein
MRATVIVIAAAMLAMAAASAAAQETGDLPDRDPDIVLVVQGFACPLCAERLAKAHCRSRW